MGELNVRKREHNRATTKHQIMEAFIEAVEHHPLDDLKVEDLCKKIGTSKVTFVIQLHHTSIIYSIRGHMCLFVGEEINRGITGDVI